MKRITLALAFVATVFAANWTLERFGMIELPLIGWMAPAGVLWAGFGFGLRDALRETGDGWRPWVAGSILTGAALSYWIGDAVAIPGGKTSIAVASGLAFGFSELLDASTYELVRRTGWVKAVVASNLVGAVVDSALFLWLAFGAVDAMGGQIVGKALMILPALPIVWAVRNRDGEVER